MITPRIRAAAALVIAALIATGGGCVTEGGRGSKSGARPPRDARPERVVLAADGRFADTDANGYGDTNQVVAYVFGEPRYAVPIEADGSFEFTLLDLSGKKIRGWSFTREQGAEHRARLPAGPGFVFVLSLLEGGGDAVQESEAELIGTFTPAAGGAPLRFRLSAPIVIGRVRPGGSRS